MEYVSVEESQITKIDCLTPTKPILEISSASLRDRVNLFLKSFPGETSFAVKANPHPQVIKFLYSHGVKVFDVASPVEVATVKQIAPDAVLHYHNPARSREETNLALNIYGCKRFAIDHIQSLDTLHALATEPEEIEVAIRFRLDGDNQAVQAFKSKFGASKADAIALLKRAKSLGFKTGLTFHPGSQTLSTRPYEDHIKVAAEISQKSGVQLAFLNIGGGFPSSYKNLQTPPLTQYFANIDIAFQLHFKDTHTSLECEPGRGMIGEAGTLKTHVKCHYGDRKELFLDDGVYGGLAEVFQFPKLQPHYALTKDKLGEETIAWTAYGPTCDPVDVLPFKLQLPHELTEGDEICFHGVGAYSLSTTTRFNGYGDIDVIWV